jgi:iron uptake system component EfeO
MRKLFVIPFLVAACGDDDKQSTDFSAEVTTAMHTSLATELAELSASARALRDAAPTHVWTAPEITAMKDAWRKTRVAYEHIEGAIAPLFPDVDFVIDARYDDYLAELAPAGDTNSFDGQGVTGMHGIERILFSADIRPEVVAFESTLPGYRAAAVPATDAEAMAFKTGIAQRLVDDCEELARQWQPAAIDVGAAFLGLVGLMNEQKEKVDLAATGEEESRYANITLFDLRNNREGTARVYEVFRAWIQSKEGGPASDSAIAAKLNALRDLYANGGDALPAVPATWSSDMPSATDLATPFGMLWKKVHDEVDPAADDSIVAHMNRVAILLGFPEFVEE